MPDPAMLDYFYGGEAEPFTFYQIPKVLFTDSSCQRISSDAKILYEPMLDRMGCQFVTASWTIIAGYSFTLPCRMLWNICAVGMPGRFSFLENWIRQAWLSTKGKVRIIKKADLKPRFSPFAGQPKHPFYFLC